MTMTSHPTTDEPTDEPTERPSDPKAAAAPLRRTVRRDDRPPPEPTEETGPDELDRPRSSRLPWVLAAIGLIGTLGFALAWLGARDGGSESGSASDGPAAELLSAARGFSEDLTNFDGATIDRDFDAITGRAAGEFRSQADQFFSSDVRSQLKKAQASSRGEIRSAYVQTVDGDRGTVFVVVDQTIANNASPQPQADTLRMELGLVRRDGTWKVERVSVLTAPSGGSTDAATGSGTPLTGGG